MARIPMIDESAAPPQLKSIYTTIAGKRGGVANVLKIHSLLPQTMEDHFNLYKTLMFDLRATGIRRLLLEMIAVVVSSANQCQYCITHHSEPLRRLLKDDETLAALQRRDWKNLESRLPKESLDLLRLAEKLTLRPAAVQDADIENLRLQGYTNEQILQVILVICYFNFVNRSVLAFGLEVEPDFEATCR
ncbi:MAG: peroxidase-related enzyme [FCB group bacterium]|nr:peroxidase-related enzyme [FCB group bacterium]